VAGFADQPTYKQELARSLGNRGVLEVRMGQTARAEDSFARSEKLLQEVAGKYPHVPACWQELSQCQQNLANLLTASERREAEDVWQRLTASQRSRSKQFPAEVSYTVELAQSLVAAGDVFIHREKFAQAETCFADALTEYRNLLRRDPRQPIWRQGLGRALLGQAELKVAADDDRAAANAVRELVTLVPAEGPEAIRAAIVLCRCR